MGHCDTPLYQSPRAIASRKNALVSNFNRMGIFFRRLEFRLEVPPTSAMVDNRANVMVGVLWFLAVATREIKQNGASESIPGDMGGLTPPY